MLGDDLTPFFNTSHFAKAATYTPGAGSPVTINGILDKEYIEINGVGGYRPTFLCAESDVASAADGDTLVVDAVTYTVRIPEPDGAGLTLLILEVA